MKAVFCKDCKYYIPRTTRQLTTFGYCKKILTAISFETKKRSYGYCNNPEGKCELYKPKWYKYLI